MPSPEKNIPSGENFHNPYVQVFTVGAECMMHATTEEDLASYKNMVFTQMQPGHDPQAGHYPMLARIAQVQRYDIRRYEAVELAVAKSVVLEELVEHSIISRLVPAPGVAFVARFYSYLQQSLGVKSIEEISSRFDLLYQQTVEQARITRQSGIIDIAESLLIAAEEVADQTGWRKWLTGRRLSFLMLKGMSIHKPKTSG